MCGENPNSSHSGSILHILLVWELAVFTLLSKVFVKQSIEKNFLIWDSFSLREPHTNHVPLVRSCSLRESVLMCGL